MIKCLSCKCHNSEPRIRRVLREAHLPDWGVFPILKGKEECLSYLETLPETFDVGTLKTYIRNSSSWTVIFGTDGNTTEWADIAHDGIKGRIDGKIIVENYK